jgi:hypothetical protein
MALNYGIDRNGLLGACDMTTVASRRLGINPMSFGHARGDPRVAETTATDSDPAIGDNTFAFAHKRAAMRAQLELELEGAGLCAARSNGAHSNYFRRSGCRQQPDPISRQVLVA